MSEIELSGHIRAWFEGKYGVGGGARRASPVWVALKEGLSVWGNWRNAPRGDPAKGWRAGCGKVEA